MRKAREAHVGNFSPLSCQQGGRQVQGGLYGTRSQSALAVWRDGRAQLRERYRPADGVWRSVRHTFHVQDIATGEQQMQWAGPLALKF